MGDFECIPEKNICLNRGADYSVTGKIDDNFGNNVDLSAATIRAEVREYAGGPLLATFSFTMFSSVAGGITTWFYTRKMAQTVINAIPADKTQGVWDQFIEFTPTDVRPMMQGDVKIRLNATNPTV